MTRGVSFFLGTALLLLAAGTIDAEVSLPAVLGEHMVVQREIPLHLWGQAAPGETVTATFRGESRSVAADELGRFGLYLPPSAAGGPFTLTVSASNTIRLDDVWVGDVWVAAGQSNMEWTLDEAEGAAAEIPQARHPEVRFLRAEHRTSSFPLADVANWGVGDFPFLFVQLASWTAGPGNAWPELREAQRQALTTVNTAMAVAIDVGHPTDIHPRDKKTVGTRLALAARVLAYGERLEHSGPLFRQVTPEGPGLRVSFDHGEGLTTRGGAEVAGFEIAGADGRYVPAEARIAGSTVFVSSAAVPSPRSVRYGWADNPRVSLYNAAGLPASPFRSAE